MTDDDHETWDPSLLLDRLPDVRDGLTRLERVILWQLHVTQRERSARVLVPQGSNGSARSARTEETGADEPMDRTADRNVPTAMLYGRVVEHVSVSVEEFQRTLQRLVGRR